MNDTSVDSYLSDGCGRCDRFQTPDCVVHLWTDILLALRELVLESELVETMKWGAPCYTLNGKNVLMIASRKEYCALSFFKGAALDDEHGRLERPGQNSRFARLLKFASIGEFMEQRGQTARLVQQAIEVERAGIKIVPDQQEEPLPDELTQRLNAEPELKEAFESLTPGRQRSYMIYIGGAKKSETRANRVERCIPKIFEGKGYNER